MSNTYNGWTNYETWNVKLWMDNDEGSYQYWRDTAHGIAGAHNEEAQLADQLKSEHEEAMPELNGTYSDLLRAALGEVNWYEIAENMLEEAHEEIKQEETA